jgi:ATP-dependent DNA helicase RecG
MIYHRHYRGLGSGIKRALEAWSEINFTDDRDGCLFTATIHRTAAKPSGKSSGETDALIIALLREFPEATIPELANKLGVTTRAVEKQIARLKKSDRLRRIGPARGGHWEVL